ncbi:Trk system potassium transporter TrkA [Putridiphycobacter roseus]|uniref:Trk system potassium uptake protein TrkA n=1 Tax=Putridiphycobacter roseus TaxID=2219161 RepID=A0A2W1NFE1_9FLAO|nr:Trk system potassium transporter TrkA [Putridiphycobacter roseus]PZE16736.1 Trk system potassium transporter TrkA [Putridiphycobacter roseus]
MKIIITGGGDVGFHLAKMLSGESQDIYLIDENKKRLNYIGTHLDVYTIEGDATSIHILKEAKVEQADLVIAVTSSEETNILVSILAKQFGAKRTIARINNQELLMEENAALYKKLGIDDLISPVQLAAKEIKRLVKRSAFTDNLEFENGKLSVIGITIGADSPLKNKTIIESAHLNPNLTFKPIALHRKEHTIIVRSNTQILANDILYFITSPESIDLIMNICDKKCFDIKDIMILGGSSIGLATASLLEKDYRVILIEKNAERCSFLAGKLKNTLVVNIDGRDVKALEEEGLGDMDAFVAVTADSESNIMSSLVAKNHNVKKTIARVENIDYIHLSQNIGIDTLINKKIIAASNIFKYIRKGEINAMGSLHGVDAEIIEFNVKANSKVTKKTINRLKFPRTANIAGVIRNEFGFIPFGDFQLKEGDKAVVFSLTESIHKIENFFS